SLRGSDPADPPVIDPNYLADERDVERLMLGCQLAREIGEARALKEWHGAEVRPGPDSVGPDALRYYVRDNVNTYFHPVGTCRIGTDPDTGAVVDLELRVHGLAGLRVADASVMPSIPSANTNATVLAIAERAADLIREGE